MPNRAQGQSIIDSAIGYSSGAVTAAQILTEYVAPCYGRISEVMANAVTAGTGGGNTVLDVQINGSSIWTTAANKPTLAATSTGNFAAARADLGGVHPGDRVTLLVSSISSTGQARLMMTVPILDE